MRAGFRMHQAFPHGKLEEGSDRGQLAGNRGFFQIVIVQVRHKFANQEVRDVLKRRRFGAGRCQKRKKLVEVTFIAAESMRRGVAHRAQIVQKLMYCGFHVPTPALLPEISRRIPRVRLEFGETEAPRAEYPRTIHCKKRDQTPDHALTEPTGSGVAAGGGGSGSGSFPVTPFLYAGAYRYPSYHVSRR